MSKAPHTDPLLLKRSPIVVDVPADIADLIGPYLARRRQDIKQFGVDARGHRWNEIQATAHRIKGNAASFGFAQLSDIGARLEVAASRHDATAVSVLVGEMGNYLERVKLRLDRG